MRPYLHHSGEALRLPVANDLCRMGRLAPSLFLFFISILRGNNFNFTKGNAKKLKLLPLKILMKKRNRLGASLSEGPLFTLHPMVIVASDFQSRQTGCLRYEEGIQYVFVILFHCFLLFSK